MEQLDTPSSMTDYDEETVTIRCRGNCLAARCRCLQFALHGLAAAAAAIAPTCVFAYCVYYHAAADRLIQVLLNLS